MDREQKMRAELIRQAMEAYGEGTVPYAVVYAYEDRIMRMVMDECK